MNIHDFIVNELIQDGVIRNFEIIGEATKHISMDFRDKNPDFPWKQMAGMRDILIHNYLGIDIYSVWYTIETNMPPLKQQLLQISNKK